MHKLLLVKYADLSSSDMWFVVSHIVLEPFAMYALDDGKLIGDSSGNSNPVGIAHNIHEADGPHKGQRSVAFKGDSTSYIRISQDGELSMNASFSILVWVWIYKDWIWSRSWGEIVTFVSGSKEVSGLLFSVKLVDSNGLVGKLYFPSSGETYEVGDVLLSFGEWHHVALVYNYDTGQASLYIDDYLESTEYVRTGTVGTHGEVIVGKSFEGRIACLQFYRRPLLGENIEDAKDKCYRASSGMCAKKKSRK